MWFFDAVGAVVVLFEAAAGALVSAGLVAGAVGAVGGVEFADPAGGVLVTG